MTFAAGLCLRVWDAKAGAAVEVPLPEPQSDGVVRIDVRCLHGASGVHVVLVDGTGVRLRAEVAADPGEVVPLRVAVDEGGVPQVTSRGKHVLLLPLDARYDPPLPIRPVPPGAPLDLAVIVDGTLRKWPDAPLETGKEAPSPPPPARPASVRLLDHEDLWRAHAVQLAEFAAHLAEGRDARLAVLAFGDQDPPAVTASDLRPSYRLHPPEHERQFQPFDGDRMRERLLALPSTPGGDFVDALADALEACAGLRWRDQARKVIVVSGDSPGLSLLHPLPKGTDLCVRQYDIDTQALRLHAEGTEIVTIYHAPPARLGFHRLSLQRDVLLGARAQYVRLASTPELAFDAAAFQPEAAADLLRQLHVAIGRSAALGALAAATAMAAAG
jgi:hypothetical protein